MRAPVDDQQPNYKHDAGGEIWKLVANSIWWEAIFELQDDLKFSILLGLVRMEHQAFVAVS